MHGACPYWAIILILQK